MLMFDYILIFNSNFGFLIERLRRVGGYTGNTSNVSRVSTFMHEAGGVFVSHGLPVESTQAVSAFEEVILESPSMLESLLFSYVTIVKGPIVW